jgi:predicted N-acetyltransferase YhbS
MPAEVIETLDAHTLNEAQARSIAELLIRVWPENSRTVSELMEQLFKTVCDYTGSKLRAPRSLVIRNTDRTIAHATVFPRTIYTSAGEMTILALARVCTDPEYRGRRLGIRIVRAAFALVDEGIFPFSIFQTSEQVRPFYERLGSCTMDNPIIDSTANDKTKSPFSDRVIMRYPSGDDWHEGEIDLFGPGY